MILEGKFVKESTMYIRSLLVALSLFVSPLWAQKAKGHWDTMRTTSETIEVRAGERKMIKTNAFPEGTNEIVYRITIMDDNQKLASSLVSVLKAIPDPTGISQGTAGAVFLASTVSGNDKATFAVFLDEKAAKTYLTTGKPTQACYTQPNPINKEARLLSATHGCMKDAPETLWFVFQSDNWLMKQKIVLEVVPWIDAQAATGWNADRKAAFLKLAVKRPIAFYLSQKETFSVALLQQVMEQMNFETYHQLRPEERELFLEKSEKAVLKELGLEAKYAQKIHDQALRLFLKGKTKEGIEQFESAIQSGMQDPLLYAGLSYCYLRTKQMTKAATLMEQASALSSTDLRLQLALAHVYLFTDRVSEAKALYKKYVMQNLPDGTPWKVKALLDIREFERSGLPNQDLPKIKRLLE